MQPLNKYECAMRSAKFHRDVSTDKIKSQQHKQAKRVAKIKLIAELHKTVFFFGSNFFDAIFGGVVVALNDFPFHEITASRLQFMCERKCMCRTLQWIFCGFNSGDIVSFHASL